MRLFNLNFINPFTLSTFSALTMSGCAGGTAASIAGGLTLGAGVTYLLERMRQGRSSLPPALSSSTPRKEERTLVVAPLPFPEIRPAPAPRAAPAVVTPPVTAEEAALRERIRFPRPYKVSIDLRSSSGMSFKIGKRDWDGLRMEDGQPVLGLNDSFISTDHADLSILRVAVQTWGLSVQDRSTNGTWLAGFGSHRGSSAHYTVYSQDHSVVRVSIGRFEIEVKLADPIVKAPEKVPERFPEKAPAIDASLGTAAIFPRIVEAKSPAKCDSKSVRRWMEAVLPADKVAEVADRPQGVEVQIRSRRPDVLPVLTLNFPAEATEQAVRCALDYLEKHCHLFRPIGLPSINLSIAWSHMPPRPGYVLISGKDSESTLGPYLGDRVSGDLSENDLKNVSGLPNVSMIFKFDPEPSRQVVRMIEQMQDAFRRTRAALEKVHAPWDVIDPIQGIFDPVLIH